MSNLIKSSIPACHHLFPSRLPIPTLEHKNLYPVGLHAEKTAVSNEACKKVNEAIFDLSKNLAKGFTSKGPGSSYAFSALSIAYVVGLILRGLKDGSTEKQQLIDSLNLHDLSENEIHKALAKITDSLSTGEKASLKLEIANALITGNPDRFPIKEEYKHFVRDEYHGEVFSGGQNPFKACNQWASEKTHGEITQILDENASADDVVGILVNAVYFKGDWTDKFEEFQTKDREFTAFDGNKELVKVMKKEFSSLKYYEDEDLQLVQIPYKIDGVEEEAFYLAVLPKEGKTLEDLQDKLDSKTLKELMNSSRSKDVVVSLPKQDITFEASILEDLKLLDLPVSSYLPNISDATKVTEIKHKAIVKVDEEGTVAAAVTAAVMKCSCVLPPQDQKIFDATRPFAYYIIKHDEEIGDTLLFQGCIKEATALVK